jgi:8-oxo-dGTP pyrophosphatase MutT (NUDIX family)
MEMVLEKVLKDRTFKRIRDDSRRLSAVLLPLYQRRNEYQILFTKRTDTVQDHKGQISFPGGGYEEQDGSLINTALRECREEVGLEPAAVQVLGRLDDALTATSNYIISPFVGLIPWPYDFVVNLSEIAELIEVPMAALLNGGGPRQETRFSEGKRIETLVYTYQDRVIWGATALILNQFLDIYRQSFRL